MNSYSLAEIARKDGLLALEAIAREIRNPFIALGVQLAVDGTRPETLSEIMQNEVEALAGRHRQAKKVVELVGRCGPAFGMIATLLGLILMLGSLSKPDTVGPSMAIALIGTLYGALLANLICIPLGEKLGYMSHEEQLVRQIVIRGILAIQAGDNPRVVRQKLDMFIVAAAPHPSLCPRRLTRAMLFRPRGKTRRRAGMDGLVRRHDHHPHGVLRRHVLHRVGRLEQRQADEAAGDRHRVAAIPLRPQVEAVHDVEHHARQFQSCPAAAKGWAANRPCRPSATPAARWSVKKKERARIRVPGQGDTIAIGGLVMFDASSAKLAAGQEKTIDRITEELAGKQQIVEIVATASNRALPPGGPYRDRWELGYARCRAVANLLAAQKIEPERFRLSVVPGYDAESSAEKLAEADDAVRVNLSATLPPGGK